MSKDLWSIKIKNQKVCKKVKFVSNKVKNLKLKDVMRSNQKDETELRVFFCRYYCLLLFYFIPLFSLREKKRGKGG